MTATIRKDDPQLAEEVARIDKRIKRQNESALARAAKWDRNARTDDEIKAAYEAAMAEKRREAK